MTEPAAKLVAAGASVHRHAPACMSSHGISDGVIWRFSSFNSDLSSFFHPCQSDRDCCKIGRGWSEKSQTYTCSMVSHGQTHAQTHAHTMNNYHRIAASHKPQDFTSDFHLQGKVSAVGTFAACDVALPHTRNRAEPKLLENR